MKEKFAPVKVENQTLSNQISEAKDMLRNTAFQLAKINEFYKLGGHCALDGKKTFGAVIGDMPEHKAAGFNEDPVQAILYCMKELDAKTNGETMGSTDSKVQ